jgi:hypothetical protein
VQHLQEALAAEAGLDIGDKTRYDFILFCCMFGMYLIVIGLSHRTELIIENSGISVSPPKHVRLEVNTLLSKPNITPSCECNSDGMIDDASSKETKVRTKDVVKCMTTQIVSDNPANNPANYVTESDGDEGGDEEEGEEEEEDNEEEDNDKDHEDQDEGDKDEEDKDKGDKDDEGESEDEGKDEDESESKDELQGASRTTGGIFRGRAKGNALNMADFHMFYTYFIIYTQLVFCRHGGQRAST